MDEQNGKEQRKTIGKPTFLSEQTTEERLPSFQHLMEEITAAGASHKTEASSTAEQQSEAWAKTKKRPRVQAQFLVKAVTEPSSEISPVSPYQTVTTTSFVAERTTGTRLISYPSSQFKETIESSLTAGQESKEIRANIAREARRERQHFRQLKAKIAEEPSRKKEALVTEKEVPEQSSIRTGSTVPTSLGSFRSTEASESTTTFDSREGREHTSQLELTGISEEVKEEQLVSEQKAEGEAGPSSVFPKHGRGRKRTHPEWTEEERRAQRIVRNREAAEKARLKRKEREEQLLRELQNAIERNHRLEEEVSRLRELLKKSSMSIKGKEEPNH